MRAGSLIIDFPGGSRSAAPQAHSFCAFGAEGCGLPPYMTGRQRSSGLLQRSTLQRSESVPTVGLFSHASDPRKIVRTVGSFVVGSLCRTAMGPVLQFN